MTLETARMWNVGVSPWIIQDGNYQDFSVGQVTAFALEFYSEEGLKRLPTRTTRKCQHLEGAYYHVSAQVIHKTDDWWVIDFGIQAYQEMKMHVDIQVGDFVEGKIYLGIDPFFYFESLATETLSPPLIYDWEIAEIAQESAPYDERIDKNGRKFLIPETTKLISSSVSKTDAWSERREQSLHYVLKCSLRGGPRSSFQPCC